MAANKFATMLHRKTNKMTLILVYALLEWILIIFLLLNSLFSYLIIKFADYFGLKRPCLWCSRVDHIFEPGKKKNSQRDFICEVHAAEISKLGYCSNHRKLAESQDMCEDCSSSRPERQRVSKNLAFFPWVKEIGMIQSEGEKKVDENGEVGLQCSCCSVILDSNIYSPYIVIKPSWGVLDYTQKGNLIAAAGDDVDDQIEEGDTSDRSRSDCLIDRCGEREGDEAEVEVDCSVSVANSGLRDLGLGGHEDEEEGLILEPMREPINEDKSNSIVEDASVEILPPPQHHLEFFVGHGGHRLIPVELIDSTTEENQINYRSKEEDDEDCDDHEANMGSRSRDERGVELIVENKSSLEEAEGELTGIEILEDPKFAVLESMEIEENENSVIFHPRECGLVREIYEHVDPQTTSEDVYNGQQTLAEKRDPDVPAVTEESFQISTNETEAVVSIGTEIPDLEPTDELQNQEILPSYTSIHEDPSTCAEFDQGSKQAEEESIELKTISVEVRKDEINNQTVQVSDLNETEEERVPDTPTSTESLYQLHKKLLLLEKRDSGTEESLDGSVVSEFEGGEGGAVMTVERLKSALRAERKALHALYGELEEERSASAVAANQTMAMINRLQEEKAAMQMEALQYQRMMEEQSEYDQEALQLLNELMVKREREKQELEKELEVYRRKVLEFQAKEKMRMLRKSNESCSASSSNAGDSDRLSIDLTREMKEEYGFERENGHHHNTPVDEVLNLEESLANFEEERLAILEQLKVLEEKLFTLDGDSEEGHFETTKPVEEQFHEEANGVANGFHEEGRIIVGAKGKRLLPLFDAIMGLENEDMEENNGFETVKSQPSASKRIELENNKVVVEEEVDHLYERLQALEADREFLKHCFSSLKKGDKGMDLLQEILQHLRDLRNVELRVRNLSDSAL